MVRIEICTESLAGVRAAEEGGAHRIELCSALEVDGLTPSPELMDAARASTRLPIVAMVRVQAGPFVVTGEGLQQMVKQIRRLRQQGADGVACGCLLEEDRIDTAAMETLLEASAGLPVTFHRAFDRIADPEEAMASLKRLGVRRLLTAGGPGKAEGQAGALAERVRQAGEEMEVVVAGSVGAHNLAALRSASGADWFHSALDRRPTAETVAGLVAAL